LIRRLARMQQVVPTGYCKIRAPTRPGTVHWAVSRLGEDPDVMSTGKLGPAPSSWPRAGLVRAGLVG
jgi:hypothetical protein